MTKELWRPIAGLEDYEASNWGRIKSLKFGKERVLNTYAGTDGALFFRPCHGGQATAINVARAVALAFYETPEGDFVVKNRGAKDDIRLENLYLARRDGATIETRIAA